MPIVDTTHFPGKPVYLLGIKMKAGTGTFFLGMVLILAGLVMIFHAIYKSVQDEKKEKEKEKNEVSS